MTNKPNAPGYYWYKSPGYHIWEIVKVGRVGNSLSVWFFGCEIDTPLAYLDGAFARVSPREDT